MWQLSVVSPVCSFFPTGHSFTSSLTTFIHTSFHLQTDWKCPLKLHFKSLVLKDYSEIMKYFFVSWWSRLASFTAVSSSARWWQAVRSTFVLTPFGTRSWCSTSALVTCLAWADSVSLSTASSKRPRSALPRRRTSVRYVPAHTCHLAPSRQADSVWWKSTKEQMIKCEFCMNFKAEFHADTHHIHYI